MLYMGVCVCVCDIGNKYKDEKILESNTYG